MGSNMVTHRTRWSNCYIIHSFLSIGIKYQNNGTICKQAHLADGFVIVVFVSFNQQSLIEATEGLEKSRGDFKIVTGERF